jgi:hypothetical protein
MKKYLPIIAISFLCFGCPSKDNTVDPDPVENITVSIISPTANKILNNNVDYEFQSTTSNPVKKVEYFVDGSSIGSVIASPYNFKWTPKDVDGGEHSLTVVATSDKNNEFKSESKFSIKLLIGDEYRGGKIFFINQDGKTGLIASKENLRDVNGYETFFWGPSNLVGTNDSDGQSNTKKMAVVSGSTYYAAYPFKNELNLNGYKDWYIPSVDELELLRDNKSIIGGFSTVFSSGLYWSSTETSATKAYGLNFVALTGTNYEKGAFYGRVRPIRKF